MTEEDITNEPTAPMVKIGQRVAYREYYGNEFGTIRWIGRVPQICSEWTVGVEFDNAIGEGDGSLNGRRYFVAKDCFAKFLPLNSVVQVDQHIGRPEPGTMISVMSAAVRPGQMISIQRVSTVHVQHCFLNAPHRRVGHDILAVNNRLHCQCPNCGPCAHVVKPSKSQRLGRAGKNATHMCQFSTYTCCGMESQENALCSYSNEPPPPPKLPPIGNSWMEGSGYLTTLQEQQSKLLPNEYKLMASGSLDRRHSRRHHHRHHHGHGRHRHRKHHSSDNDKRQYDDNSTPCNNEKKNESNLAPTSGDEIDKTTAANKSLDDDQRSYYHEEPVTSGHHVSGEESANLSDTLNGENLTAMLNVSTNYNSEGALTTNENYPLSNHLNGIDTDFKKDSQKPPGQTVYRTSIDNRYLYPTDNYYGDDRGADSEIDSDYRSDHRNSSRFSDKSRNIIKSLRSLVSCLTPSTSSNASRRSNQREFSDATISYTQSEPKLIHAATANDQDSEYQQEDRLSSQQTPRSPIPVPIGYEDNHYDEEEPNFRSNIRDNNEKECYNGTKKTTAIIERKHSDDVYGKLAERILCTAALTPEETDRLNTQLKKATDILSDSNYSNVESDMLNSPEDLNRFMARILRRAANDAEFSRKIISLDRKQPSYQSAINSIEDHNNESLPNRTYPKSFGYNEPHAYVGGHATSRSLPRNFINQSTTSGSMSISSRESCTSGTSLTGDLMAHLNDATINIPVIAPSVPQAFQLNLTLSINADSSSGKNRTHHASSESNQNHVGEKNSGKSSEGNRHRSLSAIAVSPPRYSSQGATSSTSSGSLINITLNSGNPPNLSKKTQTLKEEKLANDEAKEKSGGCSTSTAFNESAPIYATIVRASKKDRPNSLKCGNDVMATKMENRVDSTSKEASERKSPNEESLQGKSKLPNGNISQAPHQYMLEKKTDSREANDSGCENTGIM